MARFSTVAKNLNLAADRMHRNLHKHGGSITVTGALRLGHEFSELNGLLARMKRSYEELCQVHAVLEKNGFTLQLNPGMKGWKIHSLRF